MALAGFWVFSFVPVASGGRDSTVPAQCQSPSNVQVTGALLSMMCSDCRSTSAYFGVGGYFSSARLLRCFCFLVCMSGSGV